LMYRSLPVGSPAGREASIVPHHNRSSCAPSLSCVASRDENDNHKFRRADRLLCFLDLGGSLFFIRPRHSPIATRTGASGDTRSAEMSGLSHDFAKVQLQAAMATKDLQEPRLGAYPRDLSCFRVEFGTRLPTCDSTAPDPHLTPTTPSSKTEYRTVTAVSGPLVILDKVKVRPQGKPRRLKTNPTLGIANPRFQIAGALSDCKALSFGCPCFLSSSR
jgi:hypothetical protein